MSKQTAVEWLIEQYVDSAGILSPIDIQNALQMEREHIEEAYGVGHNDGCAYMTDGKTEFKNAEQYYNETYGKEASHE